MKVVLIAEMLIVLVEPKKMMVREWYRVVFVKIGSIVDVFEFKTTKKCLLYFNSLLLL
jgi:hypothetical protein